MGWNLAWRSWPKLLHTKFHPNRHKGEVVGLPKLKMLPKFWQINALQGRIPWSIFIKFSPFVVRNMFNHVSKFGRISSRGFRVMKFRANITPNFQHYLEAKLCNGSKHVFKVQERYRPPLSPRQVCTVQLSTPKWETCVLVV